MRIEAFAWSVVVFSCSAVVAAPSGSLVAPAENGLVAPVPGRTDQIPPDDQSLSIDELVAKQISKTPGYRKGDLIWQSQVMPILKEMVRRGWDSKKLNAIYGRVLPDSSLMVREAKTPKGIEFLRQSARYQMGYDRVDRLANLSDGPVVLWRLINGADGYKLIQYMATAPGGRELGVMLSRDPKAGNFNAPTGRIYTGEQLAAELELIEP
jgi:hypothetical protein